MYKIIGADKAEYGPVSEEQIRRWISEGRLNAQSAAQAEGGMEWKPLSEFPEFADALAAKAAEPPPPPPQIDVPGASPLPHDILSRDYNIDVGDCFSKGWDLFKNNFGVLFGGVVLYFLIEIGSSLLGQIPILGALVSLAYLVILGPLTGGMMYMFILAHRRYPVTVTDVFFGFRKRFLHLLIGYIVMFLITIVCFIPAIILAVISLIPTIIHHGEPTVAILGLMIIFFCLGLIPLIYLTVSWAFALPLIIDKDMDFWPAMETSRKVVGKHWLTVFGLCILCWLIGVVGFLACCVGALFTTPIAIGAMMYAYEKIFSPSETQNA